MPTFTAGSFGVDFDKIDVGVLNTGVASGQTSTAFSISVSPQIDQFTGAGFTFGANGFPTGGTITHITETFGGQVVFDIDATNVSASQFISWVGTGANETAKLTVFGGDDVINGSEAIDRLRGYGGGDTINGNGGNDFIDGGDGNNTIHGGLGDDVITASTGSNYLRGDEGNDQIVGGDGFDDANGNMGNDTISTGGGDDFSVGGKDDDLLFGDDGADIVWGNLGNDTCDGGNGADQVRGGQGDDSVSGGAGNDYVSGDRGNDTETGGSGADNFHGSQDAGIDRVLDFHLSEGDRVQLDPGTTYTLKQVGADAVLDMGGGNQMILVGVSMSSLTASTIFFG
jgi:serralysin